MAGRRPGKQRSSASVLNGLRINQGITTQMLPSISFEPTIGITAKRIDRLGMNIKSFREPLRRSIKEVVAPSIRKNFDVGGRPPWPPLAPDTLEIREHVHGRSGTSPLVSSGLLRKTASQLNVWTYTTTSAILAGLPEKVRYGGIHQAGYEGKRSSAGGKSLKAIVAKAKSGGGKGREVPPIPARPFVLLQEDDIPKIEKVFIDWMGERIDKAWPKR